MINPQELRIGNYFNPTVYVKGLRVLSGAIGKVQTLRFDSAEWVLYDKIPAQVETWTDTLYSEMEPIPLTYEWLERFGFFNPFVGPVCDKITERMDMRFRIHKVGENKFILGHYESSSKPIEYVHQLQNLYFALVGEELTIQPTAQAPKPQEPKPAQP